MRQYAPVDTGALRASFYATLNKSNHTATIFIPLFYGIYQEFGTRYIKPHPFVRPALLDASMRWHFTEVTIRLIPAPQRSEPLKATTAGFNLPKRQRLTPGQVAHVERNLTPVSAKFAKQFKQQGVSFSVSKTRRHPRRRIK